MKQLPNPPITPESFPDVPRLHGKTDSAVKFELAYQARVAMDRIRFAIKVTEDPETRQEQLREAGLQLLDALNRLKTAEDNFQRCFRSRPSDGKPQPRRDRLNGSGVRA